jgi:hypothetical protein
MDSSDSFGSDICAEGPTDIGTINVSDVESIVGGTFDSITGLNAILKILHKIAPFKVLSPSKLLVIAKKFETIVRKDELIFEEGDIGDSLYIV